MEIYFVKHEEKIFETRSYYVALCRPGKHILYTKRVSQTKQTRLKYEWKYINVEEEHGQSSRKKS